MGFTLILCCSFINWVLLGIFWLLLLSGLLLDSRSIGQYNKLKPLLFVAMNVRTFSELFVLEFFLLPVVHISRMNTYYCIYM